MTNLTKLSTSMILQKLFNYKSIADLLCPVFQAKYFCTPIDTIVNVATNPSGCHGMVSCFSVGCAIHVTSSIAVSKVSASRIKDANASTLVIVAGFESDVIANVTAIAMPATQTAVTHIPLS
jgi:hypothetical protein